MKDRDCHGSPVPRHGDSEESRLMRPSLLLESPKVSLRGRWRLLKKLQVYLSTFKREI